MFIAMNRFKIKHGQEEAFEEVWRSRDSHLKQMEGFESFRLLKGPVRDDHTLYSSHTIWRSEKDFKAWTESEAFRLAHKNAGQNGHLYLGHPEFEGFEEVPGITA